MSDFDIHIHSVRSPGGGHGNPLQYSCLENSMDRGAWQATVHGVIELDTTEKLSHEWLWHPHSFGKIPWRRAWQPTPGFLSGESPWTEEPSGLQSTESQRVGQDWSNLAHKHAWRVRIPASLTSPNLANVFGNKENILTWSFIQGPLSHEWPLSRGVFCHSFFFFSLSFFFFFFFYFIFKLYITVLDLPNIKMNPPQVYMCGKCSKILKTDECGIKKINK